MLRRARPLYFAKYAAAVSWVGLLIDQTITHHPKDANLNFFRGGEGRGAKRNRSTKVPIGCGSPVALQGRMRD